MDSQELPKILVKNTLLPACGQTSIQKSIADFVKIGAGLRQSNFNGDLKMTNDKAQMSNQAIWIF